jgi:hypothetical protein
MPLRKKKFGIAVIYFLNYLRIFSKSSPVIKLVSKIFMEKIHINSKTGGFINFFGLVKKKKINPKLLK